MPPPPSTPVTVTDGNGAAADVAYRLNDLCALYPITPSSAMGEKADEWRAAGRENLWGVVPDIVEMQSEGGAAATLHGALQAGALATTFTSSQGLLLMIPSMFKIAGELAPCVIHVAARAVATHALSIFGDHSDVMATRSTGWGQLFATSVQEAHDFALIAQAASLHTRVPFLHVFDGFRTSHEMRPVTPLADETLRALVPEKLTRSHRDRALTPDRPVIRGTSQNPDVFFQGREAANATYDQTPSVVERLFDQLAHLTGRTYAPVEYAGAADADTVLVLMGSAAETAKETVRVLASQGEKVGVLVVRLYRPWPKSLIIRALPATVRRVAVLDRTKEPGALGEPLFMDMAATLAEAGREVEVFGGRYGLGGKEFTPSMVRAVVREAAAESPRPRFTVGIEDDVTGLSLPVKPGLQVESTANTRALFYGLGSDGTVSATKNTVRILGRRPGMHAQGYFVYDSNKAGSRTVSHLRFGPDPVRAPYQIESANFIACHSFPFVHRFDLLARAEPGATLLFNAPYAAEDLPARLPLEMVKAIRDNHLRVYTVDASRVARACGLGRHINTVMQTCFFALCGVPPREEALAAIREEIQATYGQKGKDIAEANLRAVDAALDALREVPAPANDLAPAPRPPIVPESAPPFARNVLAPLLREEGDRLPVSAMPADGTWPVGTARWNRRDLSDTAPVWDPDLCIQCGQCVAVCPHGVIRVKQARGADLEDKPEAFPAPALRGADEDDARYLLQLDLPQCTGCGLCIEICPAKSKTQANHKALEAAPKAPRLEREEAHLDYFRSVPARHEQTQHRTLRGVQYLPQRFEFPGACAGCGETGALKLVSQLFGDRMLVANATGCSSIYGGNLPTTPWSVDENGRGPAWANSLFEDNAEFGLGFRLAVDQKRALAERRVREFAPSLPDTELAKSILDAPMDVPSEREAQRERLRRLDRHLADTVDAETLAGFRAVADSLVPRSVWIVGGDGWACDIGFGGLDHVLSGGRDVNLLVLDTEVYSNTGGQASKSTPLGAVAKFAAGGKATRKTDLALHGILKGDVYVGTIALGAKLPQALRTLTEAEAWPGPSLVLAYSPCIAHGYPLEESLGQQKNAVMSGHWPLFRYNPALRQQGKPALIMDSPDKPVIPLKDYTHRELRYKLLDLARPEHAKRLLDEAEAGIHERMRLLRLLAGETPEASENQ